MSKREIDTFRRTLGEGQTPNEHQRKFLHLPLPIFRDYTNIHAIISKYEKQTNGKALPQIAVKQKVRQYHERMSDLDAWNALHLDELEFIASESDTKDSVIWRETVGKRRSIYKKASDHEKQFIHLPYHILVNATNIRECAVKTYNSKGSYKHIVTAINQLFDQMPRKSGGNWHSAMANLRFVETIEDDSNANATGNAITEPAAEETASSVQAKSKPMPKSAKAKLLQSSKIDDAAAAAEPEAKKKTKKATTEGSKKDKTTSKSSASNATDRRLATRSKSTPDVPNQTTDRSTPEPRKRKSNSNLDENETPNKRTKSPDRERTNQMPTESTPKAAKSRVPEIIRSPRKTPATKVADTQANSSRQSQRSTENGLHSKQQQAANPKSTPKGQRKISLYLSRADKSTRDNEPTLPKRKTISSTPEPLTPPISHTIEQNRMNEPLTPIDLDNVDDEFDLPTQQYQFDAEEQRKRDAACSPSIFQQEISKLSLPAFIEQTNIKELIIKEFHKLDSDENAEPSDEDMQQRLEFYYNFRKRTNEWHKNCIKNLKFKQCECTRNSAVANDESSSAEKSHRSEGISEFQKEVMALSMEDFIKQTNIKEIITEDFIKKKGHEREMTENDMEIGLAYYEKRRAKPEQWGKTSLRRLKFTTCECKRKTQFEDRSVGTDAVEMRDAQNDPMEVDAAANAENDEQQLTTLGIHQINESEYICVFRKSSDLDPEMNTENQVVICILPEAQDENAPADTQNTTLMTTQETTTPQTPTPTQDTTMMPSPDASPTENNTQSSSSQSVAASGKEVPDLFAMLPSQQIVSLAEVRMSELIEGTPNQNVVVELVNPLETEAALENMFASNPTHCDESQETIAAPTQHQQDSTPSSLANKDNTNDASQLEKNSEIPSQNSLPSLTPNIKVEKNTANNSSVANDSDCVCLGEKSEEIIDLCSDDPSTEDMFYQCNNTSADDNVVRENLITVQTQPSPVKESDQITSRDELISILAADVSPIIEDSQDASRINSPFRDRLNLRSRSLPSTPKTHQPTASRSKINLNQKRSRTTHNDSLSSIPVPRYDYQPLLCITTQKTNMQLRSAAAARSQEQSSNSSQIETSQPSPKNTTNYSIEDSSSTDESTAMSSHANGMITDSCVERANLLNQDNTLFLDINTQPTDNAPSNESLEPPEQPLLSVAETTVNNQNDNIKANANPIVSAPEVATEPIFRVPSTLSRLNIHDQIEFLHYVDIKTIQSSLKNVITAANERVSCLSIEATLQHQCNANNRIVVRDEALKFIMKLTDREWAAAKAILTKLRTFWFDSNHTVEPMDGSVLHRTMYYLFKSTSKISNVHIAYGDSDLETVRVVCKPNVFTENITSNIAPFALAAMKAKVQEIDNNKQPQSC